MHLCTIKEYIVFVTVKVALSFALCNQVASCILLVSRVHDKIINSCLFPVTRPHGKI